VLNELLNYEPVNAYSGLYPEKTSALAVLAGPCPHPTILLRREKWISPTIVSLQMGARYPGWNAQPLIARYNRALHAKMPLHSPDESFCGGENVNGPFPLTWMPDDAYDEAVE
jgi:hypothetical protein